MALLQDARARLAGALSRAATYFGSSSGAPRAKFGTDARADARARDHAKRLDAWVNTWTGMGTSRDKTVQTQFLWDPALQFVELESLYYGDDLAATIVDTKPEEEIERGYDIEEYAGADALKKQLDALCFDDKWLETMRWSRLYGGAAMVVGADDGLDPQYPLAVERVRSVKFLNVLDCRYLFPIGYYSDPLSANYGDPEIYEVISPLGGSVGYVHETRLLRHYGVPADRVAKRRLRGWSYSVLQRPYDVLQKFALAFGSAAQLITDAGQGVFKVTGLLDAIEAGDEDSVASRYASVDQQRSSGRSLLLDESEDFERKPVQIAGVADIIDRWMQRLSAASDGMPVTKLFGRSAAGMNATGENDMKGWRQKVANGQKKDLVPDLTRMCLVLSAGKFDGMITPRPLEDRDEAKEAAVEKTEAETWKLYVDMGALHPEQVALAEFADEPVEIDVAKYKKAIKAEVELSVETAGQPPPTAPETPPAMGGETPTPPPEEPEPADDRADGREPVAQRWAAFWGDVKDRKTLGLVVDQAVFDEVASLYDLEPPKFDPKP